MSSDASPPACVPDDTGSCSICGDEGRTGVVLPPVEPTDARVRFENGVERVALDLLDDVRPGERIVVHMGFAIARLREDAGRNFLRREDTMSETRRRGETS